MFTHLFSVQCQSVLAELKAFAMGFSWSPFVAQGLAMTVVDEELRTAACPRNPHILSLMLCLVLDCAASTEDLRFRYFLV